TPMKDSEKEETAHLTKLATEKQRAAVTVPPAVAISALSNTSATAPATSPAAVKRVNKRRRAPSGEIAPKVSKKKKKAPVAVDEEDEDDDDATEQEQEQENEGGEDDTDTKPPSPKKQKTDDQSSSVAATATATATPTGAPPKRRGRPPKKPQD